MHPTPPLHQRRDLPAGTVDLALRRALAPILSEDLPLRLRVTLDAMRQKGTADDPEDDPNTHLPR